MRRVLVAVFCSFASLTHAASLQFIRDGAIVRTLDDAALRAACAIRTVEVEDPYYETPKRYRACPLAAVIAAGFGAPPERLDAEDVIFKALDGYAKPSTLARVAEDGGFVAFGEADRDAGFAPMGRRGLDPGPLYVVWTKPEQRDTHKYPWPYQLAAIELATLAKKFPHTVPEGVRARDPAWRGYEIFRTECIACHSVNLEGGAVGPELNVPRSVLEYWPVNQVKAYIKNPATFRYGNMPSHEHLSAADLDALVAYFRAMQARKHDPGGRPQ
jgi:mono/diheme cytochrome c family protein